MVRSNDTYNELETFCNMHRHMIASCICDHETTVEPVDVMQLPANNTAAMNWNTQWDRQICAPSLGLALLLIIPII